jgi:hypothetical protein
MPPTRDRRRRQAGGAGRGGAEGDRGVTLIMQPCAVWPMHKLLWKSSLFSAVGLLVTAILPLPLQAETGSDDYIEAAFSACLGHPSTIERRLETLNGAGWIVAHDSAEISELYGLAVAVGLGFGHPTLSLVTDYDLFERTGRIDPVPRSYLRGHEEDRRVDANLRPGLPVNVEGVVEFAQRTEGRIFLNLVSNTTPAVLSILMYGDGKAARGYSIACSLALTAPITTSDLVSYIPGDVRPADLRRATPHFMDDTYGVDYATMSGLKGEVRYLDLSNSVQMAAFRSRYGLAVELAAIVRLETQDVRLSDSASSFRRIKP